MSTNVRISKGKDGRRLMFIVASNGYLDRDFDHVAEKALQRYVDNAWIDDEYVGTNVLLCWHSDLHRTASRNAIGDIIWCDMIHGFLVEIARERVDETIDISRKINNGPPMLTRVKDVWDMIEREPIAWGASIGFAYMTDDNTPQLGMVYDEIYKYETSVLPSDDASNAYTLSQVIRGQNNE